MEWLRAVVPPGLLLCGLASADGGEPRFVGLGVLPGSAWSTAAGVSANGAVVAGTSGAGATQQAFRWTAGGGMKPLGMLPAPDPGSTAYGISADGAVVVGQSRTGDGYGAFYHTEAAGIVGLGYLPGGAEYSEAAAASADGSVIVGTSLSEDGARAFRWTASTGMVGLGDLPGGAPFSGAVAVSDDGTVVCGSSSSSLSGGLSTEAFRWTLAAGMQGLGGLPWPAFASRGTGMNPDGSMVMGKSQTALGKEAFRWTPGAGVVAIGMPAGGTSCDLYDSAASGVGVGTAYTTAPLAVIWDPGTGLHLLKEWLLARGVAEVGGWTLTSAAAITRDGGVVVGTGINPQGAREAWLVRLPPPCYANCDGSTTAPVLNVADYACFLGRFAAGEPAANCDGSLSPPVLNVADFVCFANRFAAGCP